MDQLQILVEDFIILLCTRQSHVIHCILLEMEINETKYCFWLDRYLLIVLIQAIATVYKLIVIELHKILVYIAETVILSIYHEQFD